MTPVYYIHKWMATKDIQHNVKSLNVNHFIDQRLNNSKMVKGYPGRLAANQQADRAPPTNRKSHEITGVPRKTCCEKHANRAPSKIPDNKYVNITEENTIQNMNLQ